MRCIACAASVERPPGPGLRLPSRASPRALPPTPRRARGPRRPGATRPRTAAPQPVAAAPQSVDRASGATSRRPGVGRVAAPWPSRSESRSLDSPLATPFPPSSLGPRRLRRCAAELAGPHRHRLPPPWDSESEPGQRCLPASPGASPHGTPESRHVAPASTGHVSPASPARTPSLSRASRPRESARVRVGNPGRPPSQCGPRRRNPSPSRWPAVCVTRVAIRCDLSRAADRGPRLGRGPGSTWSAPGDPPWAKDATLRGTAASVRGYICSLARRAPARRGSWAGGALNLDSVSRCRPCNAAIGAAAFRKHFQGFGLSALQTLVPGVHTCRDNGCVIPASIGIDPSY